MAALLPSAAFANFLNESFSRSVPAGNGYDAGNKQLNYIHSEYRQSSMRRGSLFCLALALHVGLLAAIATVETKNPEPAEAPLMVQFIDPPKPLEAAGPVTQIRPLPMAAPPKPVVIRKPVPSKPAKAVSKPQPAPPLLETTADSEPAPASAPVETAPTSAPVADAGGKEEGGETRAPAGGGGGSEGAVVGARFNADYLRNPIPTYPPQSRRLGEEGKVVLRVFVSAEGSAEQVEIKTSSGSRRLDESALRTVWRWTFVPAKRAGVAIESWVLVPILFRLE